MASDQSSELIERLKTVSDAQLVGDAPFLSALGAAFQELAGQVERRILSGSEALEWARQFATLAYVPRGMSALERQARASLESDRADQPIEAPDLDLRRVIPVGKRFAHSAGVRLQTIEVYDRCLVIRWAKRLGNGASEPALVWLVRDDKGTTYNVLSARGGSDGRGVWRGEVSFQPSPPIDAEFVHIGLHGQQIKLALR